MNSQNYIDLRSIEPFAKLDEIEREAWRFATNAIGLIPEERFPEFFRLVMDLGHARRAVITGCSEAIYRFANSALDALTTFNSRSRAAAMKWIVFGSGK